MKGFRIALFVSSFVVAFFSIHVLSLWQARLEAVKYDKEISILHGEIENRFRLLTENYLSILLVSSSFIGQSKNFDANYDDLALKVLQNFHDILGLNFINPDGVITRAMPFANNKAALGKITQNLVGMKLSLERSQPLYLSAPFQLYQGIRGIGMYRPVFNNQKFLGWIVLVQGLDQFMDRFVNSSFLDTYHLVINDVETGTAYYQSAPYPDGKVQVTARRTQIQGRDIEFISWKIVPVVRSQLVWIAMIILSLILSVLVVIFHWSLEQRSKSRKALANIETLLKATFRSTSNNITDLHEQLELIKLGSGFVPLKKISDNIFHLSSLIEQIKSLVDLSDKDQAPSGLISILPMLTSILEKLSSSIRVRDLKVVYQNENMQTLKVRLDHWGQISDVIESVLTFLVTYSLPAEELKLSVGTFRNRPAIIFQLERRLQAGALENSLQLQKIQGELRLLSGSIDFIDDTGTGTRVLLTIPGTLVEAGTQT